MYLDTITRVYKNAGGDILATQTLHIVSYRVTTEDGAGRNLVTPASQDTRRFKRYGGIGQVTLQEVSAGEVDRVIDSVVTTGAFDSMTTSAGDVTSVTYNGNSDTNDLVIGISTDSRVYNIGDTI